MTRTFRQDDSGAGTITALFGFVLVLVLGGLALDVSNAWRVREILQSTAEAAAISAAIEATEPREGHSPAAIARQVAHKGLAAANLLDAWQTDSFQLGRHNETTGVFVAGAADPNAVEVRLRKTSARNSELPTFLLMLVGHRFWNVQGSAIAKFATTPKLGCDDPLLSVQARADAGATDAYLGVCVFASGTADYGGTPVWQTDAADTLIDGMLAEAIGLTGVETDLALLGGDLSDVLDVADWSSIDVGQQIITVAGEASVVLDAEDLNQITLTAGGAYRVRCDDYEVATVPAGTRLENLLLVSECPVKFEADVSVEASLIISNLLALMDVLETEFVQPDAVLHSPPPCLPGTGVKVFLYADVDIAARVPALVSEASPLGRYLDETVTATGETISDLEEFAGDLFNALADEISETLAEQDLLPVCLNAHTTLSGDTVVLR
ncbi:pilus assembly protein TadG-related protein [Pseudoruegeria sp. HB172150]|uniref:pilus assembly protein TadG-related protein n=1 Tax=Pseudoruegeria sp. HB172150 TaxID=2721164 RepID=UPI0015559026|nr:pilus assembly protein TadG-related protein [Pseudoruegeria sp. HB172150]